MCVLLVAALLGGALVAATAQQQQPETSNARPREVIYGSLSEIKNRRRALLLTNRNSLIDSRGSAHSVLSTIYQSQTTRRFGHQYAHNIIGRKLNKYIRSHRSLGAVERLADADFIIVFNVLRESPSFMPAQPYVYGEMFVVLNGSPQDPRPRIIWQTEKELTKAEDAVGMFIKQLKIVRGEK